MKPRDEYLIEAFIEMLSAERGAAENTLSSYFKDLDDFSQFTKTKNTALIDIGVDYIRDYLVVLDPSGICRFFTGSQTFNASAVFQIFI